MRVTIKKSLRFEVFNRDSFTCRYCGKTPPEVVLHVDHLVPVVSGGLNELENLLTACQDCNLGKGVKHLQDQAPAPDVQKKLRLLDQDRLEMERYLEAFHARQEVQSDLICHFRQRWGQVMGSNFAPKESIIEGWVRRFDPEIIDEAFCIASRNVISGKLQLEPNWAFTETVKYTVGIMKKIEERLEAKK
jgi:hypothetical protein